MISTFLAICIALELARRLPLFAAFRKMARSSNRARRVLRRRRASDIWKERALRTLSGRLFGQSLFAALLLLAVAAPLILLLILDRPLRLGAIEVLLDWRARLQLLALVLIYGSVRFLIVRRLRAR